MREHLTAVVLCSCLLCATSFNVGHTIPLPGWKGRPSSRPATLLAACNARILVDFADQAQVHPWRGVNDVIMGGRSTGSMTFDSAEAGGRGAAVFTGVVTSAGGGGFSSVRPTMLIRIGTHAHQHMHALRLDVFRVATIGRSRDACCVRVPVPARSAAVRSPPQNAKAQVRSGVLEEDCSSSSGLRIQCKGDGRIYKMQITCDQRVPGVKYQVEFPTVPDQWVSAPWVSGVFRISPAGVSRTPEGEIFCLGHCFWDTLDRLSCLIPHFPTSCRRITSFNGSSSCRAFGASSFPTRRRSPAQESRASGF